MVPGPLLPAWSNFTRFGTAVAASEPKLAIATAASLRYVSSGSASAAIIAGSACFAGVPMVPRISIAGSREAASDSLASSGATAG